MGALTPWLPAAATLGGIFVGLFVGERLRPLRRSAAAPGADTEVRLVTNMAVSAAAGAAALGVVRPAVERALSRETSGTAGLVRLLDALDLPRPAQRVVAFLAMDLAFYYWHRANHRIGPLWRFHLAHHVDPALDVSTASRFHPGEIALSAGFRVAQVLLVGLRAPTYAAYEVAFVAATLFHHSNLRLPLGLERALSRVVVTPRMHGIHHSKVRRELDSNFGTVFTFWDRVHRTLRLNVPQRALAIGVPGYGAEEGQRVGATLALPFGRLRVDWARPEATREQGELVGPKTRLAP